MGLRASTTGTILHAVLPSVPSQKTTARPRVWTTYLFFVLTFGAMLLTTVASVGLAFVHRYGTDAPLQVSRIASYATEPQILILSMWVTAATLISMTLLATRLSRKPVLDSLGLRPRKLPWSSVLIAALGAPALGAVLETVISLFSIEESGTLKVIADAIENARGLEVPLFILGISLGPGIGEELMFRGYIQPRLIARHGPKIGIVITSALFGLLHIDALQSPLAAALGVYIGLVAYYFDSIWPAMVTHGLNNFLSVTLLHFFPQAGTEAEPNFMFGAICLIVFLCCLRHVVHVGQKSLIPSP